MGFHDPGSARLPPSELVRPEETSGRPNGGVGRPAPNAKLTAWCSVRGGRYFLGVASLGVASLGSAPGKQTALYVADPDCLPCPGLVWTPEKFTIGKWRFRGFSSRSAAMNSLISLGISPSRPMGVVKLTTIWFLEVLLPLALPGISASLIP